MDKAKQDHFLKTQKFETLLFALDCIRSLKEISGEVSEDDYMNLLIRAYDEAFIEGQKSILDKYIYSMFQDQDEIENKINQGE